MKSIMEDFTNHLFDALENEKIVNKFCLIFERTLSKSTTQINEAVAELQQTVVRPNNIIKQRDEEIVNLKKVNLALTERMDDLEQYSRKPSIRVYGVPKSTPGNTDEKLLHLFNAGMKLRPQLELSDIEVSHRIGKVPAENAEGQPPPAPRPIIARLSSRRIKQTIMKARSKLRNLGKPQRESADEEDGVDETEEEELEDENDHDLSQHFPNPIYINDDLTKPRAQLAKKCRDLKLKKSISDTWVFDGRILVKDLHGRVHEVKR